MKYSSISFNTIDSHSMQLDPIWNWLNSIQHNWIYLVKLNFILYNRNHSITYVVLFHSLTLNFHWWIAYHRILITLHCSYRIKLHTTEFLDMVHLNSMQQHWILNSSIWDGSISINFTSSRNAYASQPGTGNRLTLSAGEITHLFWNNNSTVISRLSPHF